MLLFVFDGTRRTFERSTWRFGAGERLRGWAAQRRGWTLRGRFSILPAAAVICRVKRTCLSRCAFLLRVPRCPHPAHLYYRPRLPAFCQRLGRAGLGCGGLRRRHLRGLNRTRAAAAAVEHLSLSAAGFFGITVGGTLPYFYLNGRVPQLVNVSATPLQVPYGATIYSRLLSRWPYERAPRFDILPAPRLLFLYHSPSARCCLQHAALLSARQAWTDILPSLPFLQTYIT